MSTGPQSHACSRAGPASPPPPRPRLLPAPSAAVPGSSRPSAPASGMCHGDGGALRAPSLVSLASCGHRPLVRAWKTPDSSVGKESACYAGDTNAGGSIPGSGRSAGEGKSYPLQYSGLENSMDCTVYGVAKSRTQPSDFHFWINPVMQCWSCKASCLIVMMEDPGSERRDVLPKVMRPVQAKPPLGTQSPCRCARLTLTIQLV